MHTYIVNGYGVPQDIFADEHYTTYLQAVFNIIYEHSHGSPVTVIFSGGPTSMHKPYEEGTEAEAMRDYFQSLCQGDTKNWTLLIETRAISSVENLLFSKEKMPRSSFIGIFCEWTRMGRIRRLAERIFHDPVPTIFPIDFDQSGDRHLDPEFLHKKEARATAHDLWALENEANLAQHHADYEEKLRRLRASDITVSEWWEEHIQQDSDAE